MDNQMSKEKKYTFVIPGKVIPARFVKRPNRFVVLVIPAGKDKIEKAYLRDPGRLKELLVPNVKLFIRNNTRKLTPEGVRGIV